MENERKLKMATEQSYILTYANFGIANVKKSFLKKINICFEQGERLKVYITHCFIISLYISTV